MVLISTNGVSVKENKVGKAKVLFGPSALEQVKCKVGQSKRKNELTVKLSQCWHVPIHLYLFSSACPPIDRCVCVLTLQLTDPPTGNTVHVNTKEAAKISAALSGAQKKVAAWRSKS